MSEKLPYQLDAFEKRMLGELQRDGRLGVQELATRVGLSTTPCWRRLKAMEAAGVIERYVALVDPDLAGVPETVFAQISLTQHDRSGAEAFERMVMTRPEVVECFAMTGDADYLLRIVVPDVRAYDRFLKETVFTLPAVHHVKSSFALRRIKFEVALPIV